MTVLLSRCKFERDSQSNPHSIEFTFTLPLIKRHTNCSAVQSRFHFPALQVGLSSGWWSLRNRPVLSPPFRAESTSLSLVWWRCGKWLVLWDLCFFRSGVPMAYRLSQGLMMKRVLNCGERFQVSSCYVHALFAVFDFNLLYLSRIRLIKLHGRFTFFRCFRSLLWKRSCMMLTAACSQSSELPAERWE